MRGRCPYCKENDALYPYHGELICQPCMDFFIEKESMNEMEMRDLEKYLREGE